MVTWILVGYIAKKRLTRAGYVSPYPDYPDAGFPCDPPVEEICSVSQCISRGIRNSEDPLDLYPEASQAWAAVPVEARADYALYAYRLWPVQFEDGQEEPIDLWWEPAAEPLADSFVRLGWDAVEGGNNISFGCSPMSCNSGAHIVRCPEINRYCLVGDEQAAIALARSFSITKPEPGPYCVVEVWRDMAAGADLLAARDNSGNP